MIVGNGWNTSVFTKNKGAWKRVGQINLADKDIDAALAQRKFKAVTPNWKDLEIDGKRYRVTPIP